MRSSLQGAVVLGVAMIGMIWAAVWINLSEKKAKAIGSSLQETANLARSFEEQLARIVRGEDGTLVILRSMLQRDPNHFRLVDWSRDSRLISDNVLQYGVIDASGILVASSRGPVPPIDLKDRDHFRFHAEGTADELFISKPLIGRHSSQLSIQLSRRISNGDGSFGGVVVASLDPRRLVSFYDSIDIGQDGAIAVFGVDGHVRVSRGYKQDMSLVDHENLIQLRLKDETEGSYETSGTPDGISRIGSFRKVAGLPLIVSVGFSIDEVLVDYLREERIELAAAGLSTAVVLLVVAYSVRNRRRLETVHQALRRSEAAARESRKTLRRALNNISQGILMADGSGNVVLVNRRLIELLDLPAMWLKSPPDLKTMIRFLIERGEYGKDGELMDAISWQNVLKGGIAVPIARYERTRPNGQVLAINARELPDGGMVRTFADITERKEAENRIAQMATHDELTGLANRTLFRDRIDHLLQRGARNKESFGLLLLDLDRFKPVNDTLGHMAGDEVLKEVAERLRQCADPTDTVARLGGDEFAILKPHAACEADIAVLAERVLRAIGEPIITDGRKVNIGVTIGAVIACKNAAGKGDCNYSQLMSMADQALYTAKKEGRNRCCFARSGFLFRLPGRDNRTALPAAS